MKERQDPPFTILKGLFLPSESDAQLAPGSIFFSAFLSFLFSASSIYPLFSFCIPRFESTCFLSLVRRPITVTLSLTSLSLSHLLANLLGEKITFFIHQQHFFYSLYTIVSLGNYQLENHPLIQSLLSSCIILWRKKKGAPHRLPVTLN